MFENFSFIDRNFDGLPDYGTADSNNDGCADTTLSDSNYDGYWDTYQFDLNKDGYLETIGHDNNQNRFIESVEIDTNFDGYADTVVSDYNEDGVRDGGGSSSSALPNVPIGTGSTPNSGIGDMDGGMRTWTAPDTDTDRDGVPDTFDSAPTRKDGDGNGINDAIQTPSKDQLL